MTANLTPEVKDASLLSGAESRMTLSSADPMYTVPKFKLYSLHQTEIHFRSPTVMVLGIFRVMSWLLKARSMYFLLLALSSYSYTSPVLGTRILVVETSATLSGEPSVPTQKNAS